MTDRIYAYRKGPSSKGTRRNASPEHALQVAVAEYLWWALPADCIFTASQAGARMSMATAAKAKAAGQARGWPDIQIMPPDGVCRFIELKSETGSLTPDQRAFRDRCISAKERTGRIVWSLARDLDEVEAALIRFGIQPRRRVAKANRYAIGEFQLGPED